MLNQDKWLFEKFYWKKGYKSIAGIDEAGRGPLAGPVVAAACILPVDCKVKGIDDSKKLCAKRRKDIALELLENKEVICSVAQVDAQIIDQINILQATFLAMKQAVERLKARPDYLLVDGNQCFSKSYKMEAIIKGDSRSMSIGAASILAKHTRDEIMHCYHEEFPQYEFSSHKGYATKKHIELIKQYGPCKYHRMSFAPIKQTMKPADLFEGIL